MDKNEFKSILQAMKSEGEESRRIAELLEYLDWKIEDLRNDLENTRVGAGLY